MSERGRRTGEEEAECRTRNSKVSSLVSLCDSLCHDQYMPPVVTLGGMFFFPAAQAIFYIVSSAAFHFGLRNLKYHNESVEEQKRELLK